MQKKHNNAASFPFMYLGLPLSDRKLTKLSYKPMIQRIESALAGWQTPCYREEEDTLTNAMLTTIPVYHMTMILMPKGILKE
jgi:hypothetical protein